MKLEDQVVSFDLAKRLKELGEKQDGHFSWLLSTHGQWELTDLDLAHNEGWLKERSSRRDTVAGVIAGGIISERVTQAGHAFSELSESYSAFTVAELGERLPIGTELRRFSECWQAYFPCHSEMSGTEADARAKMRIYLLEQKLVTPEKERASDNIHQEPSSVDEGDMTP